MEGQILNNHTHGAGAGFDLESTRCSRCGGLMKKEWVFDLVENEIEFNAARCLQCGDIVDPVILMNRSGKRMASSSSGRARH